jgi:hypothetical protein
MFIDFTVKQFFCVSHALAIMIQFYNNDFSSICKEVGESYGARADDIKNACAILTTINVTAPVKKTHDKLMDILSNIHQNHEEIQEHERNTQYKYRVTMDASSWKTLVDALDVYSRILMGQFSIIYEELDISGDDEIHLRANHDARWYGVGVQEARDLLIPQLKKLGVGWNGNFGISNSELAYNSKLSYEILKTIRYACDGRDSIVLHVTDEPLPTVTGGKQIKAL